MQKIILSLVLILVVNVQHLAAQNPFEKYAQVDTPTLFETGTLSINGVQWNNAFDKHGNFYFTKQGKTKSYLMVSRFHKGQYLSPEHIRIDTAHIASDIYVNSEGDQIIYMSTKPIPDGADGFNLWVANRTNEGWKESPYSDATSLEEGEAYPWQTRSGNLYFSKSPADSRNSDIYMATADGKEPTKLSDAINTENFEGDAYISQDEDFMIFAAFDRADNLGLSDLYISFKSSKVWSKAKWMGNRINSAGYDGSPVITGDGKFLVFTSSRASLNQSTIFFNHYIIPFNKDDWR